MMRDRMIVRGIGRLVAPFAILLLLAGPSAAQKPGQATMLRAKWMDPGEAHTIEPHGTITKPRYPSEIVTKLPPPEDLKGDLTMTILVEVDTSTGLKAPLKYTQRSGILTITPSPEDLKDDVIQPSAIEGTTAKIHVEVTAHGDRLNVLKPVYHEQVKIWLPAQKGKQQGLNWVWKPYGKHKD